MKKSIFSILLSFSIYCAYSQNIYSCDSGIIKFRSSALLELIDANSSALNGKIDVNKKTFAFVVRIISFKGFNVELQKDHFNENYMESTKYPYATFLGKIIEEIDFSSALSQPVRAKGIITIHGIEQERIIRATIRVTDTSIQVYSKFNVVLSDHKIKVPKVVHEKIASKIFVEIDADLKKKQ